MKSQTLQNVVICSNVELGFFYEIFKRNLDQRFTYEMFYTVSGQEYKKSGSMSRLGRVFLRLKMFVVYPINLTYRILKSKPGDTFVVSSNCFFAPLIGLLVSRLKGAKTIFLLYDLYPEALVAANIVLEYGVVYKLLGRIISYTIKKSHGVVYLGAVLRSYTERTWGSNTNSICIDVGNGDFYNSVSKKSNSDETIWVRYGGQLGELHAAETVGVSLKKYLSDCAINKCAGKIRFDFFSAGVGFRYLKKTVLSNQVAFNEPIVLNWQIDSTRYQCGLVTLSPEGAFICLPSKIYGILASGQAVISICPVWSDLAGIIIDNKCGWVINNTNLRKDELCNIKSLGELKKYQRSVSEIASEFCSVMLEIENNPDKVYELRRNSVKAAKEKYDAAVITRKWNKFIGEKE
jgi:hypothetical protein